MIDQQKRRTLKIFAGTGVGASLAAVPLAGHAAALMSGSPESAAQGVVAPLQIEIMAGRAIPGDSVIIRNTTSDNLTIEQFLPGVVTYKDSMLDLNTLLKKGKLKLAPEQVVSVTVAEWWQLLASPQYTDYLWADESAIELSKDTHVIKLNGVLQGQSAVLSTVATSIYS